MIIIIIIHSIYTAGFLGLYNYTIFTYSAECVVAI